MADRRQVDVADALADRAVDRRPELQRLRVEDREGLFLQSRKDEGDIARQQKHQRNNAKADQRQGDSPTQAQGRHPEFHSQPRIALLALIIL